MNDFKYKFIIEDDRLERLDIYLNNNLPLNRSQIKKLILNEKVNVNDKFVKAGYILKKDDVILCDIVDNEIEIYPENIDFSILYEDEYLAIISKPQNLVVHPGAGNLNHTLVNGLLYKFDKLSNIGEKFRNGIVHRLDKDTSGLMIITKTNEAYEKLINLFKQNLIIKEYLAIVKGVIYEEGIVDKPIGRDSKNRIKMAITENGKSAITEYKVLENYKDFTLLLVRIHTGRTHQIRVHMNSLNHPIIGDLVYGNKNKYGIDKQLLHSYKLEFKHPITHEEIKIIDEFPNRFESFIRKYK